MILAGDLLVIGIFFAIACMIVDVIQQGLTDYNDELDSKKPQLLNE